MSDPFEALAQQLGVGPVTKPADPAQPQRMNANSFCIRNKVFAMRTGADLVLKLPPRRVAELIAARLAVPNVVGGRLMKEWANLPPDTQQSWPELARESLAYVRGNR